MNDERLQTLQARAKQATETAAMLELLKGADPHKAGACVSFTWRGETAELFKESTLKDIIGLGRLEMMKTLEAQLEALLGNPPAADDSLPQPVVWKANCKGECPVCGFEEIARCRCMGPHTLCELKAGHGSICSQGHHWSGNVVWNPAEAGCNPAPAG